MDTANWFKEVVLLEIILAPGEETKIPKEYVDEILRKYLNDGYLRIIKENTLEEYYILEVVDEYKTRIIVNIIPTLLKKINSEISSIEAIPYDEITVLIFKLGSKGTKFKDSDDQIYSRVNTDDDSRLLIDKINRHIRLSKTQFNQIIQVSEEAKAISNKTLKDIKSISSIKGQIYSEFIAILGIFSALIFGLFGGFEGVKGVLSLFENRDSFGVISMYCGLLTFMIVTITFALIQLTGRLIGKFPKSCSCNSDKCECKWYDRYKIYAICGGVSIGMIVVGIIYDLICT